MKKYLTKFGNPEIIQDHLHHLNNNKTAGDIIIFGAYKGNAQVTFENQVGSHSAIGGDQMTPFVLTKKEWKLDFSDVLFSYQLYGKFMKLKKQLGIL